MKDHKIPGKNLRIILENTNYRTAIICSKPNDEDGYLPELIGSDIFITTQIRNDDAIPLLVYLSDKQADITECFAICPKHEIIRNVSQFSKQVKLANDMLGEIRTAIKTYFPDLLDPEP